MRPFKVLGIQQIAIGGEDKSKLAKFWIDIMGLEMVKTFKSEKENVDEDIVTMGAGPFTVEVDLMQPIDPDRSPKVHVPPLNHIGLWIDDLPGAVAWLSANGVRFTPGGIRRGGAAPTRCNGSSVASSEAGGSIRRATVLLAECRRARPGGTASA